MALTLSTSDHSRDCAGLEYIYPVLSRRAGGLSIGVNFNTNSACNWRCIYCQVPDLTIGAAPDVDLALLEDELRFFLAAVKDGGFFEQFQVAEEQRVIKDIAISGNGEPTSLKGFAEAVELIGAVATEFGVFPDSRFVLITNGSLVHLPRVQEGLKVLSLYGGEVWFKLDSATEEGRALMNNAAQGLSSAVENLLLCASLCTTKLQVCVLDIDGQGLMDKEKQAFLSLFKNIKKETNVHDIMLYTLARPALQPEAARLKKLAADVMEGFADEIRCLGFAVSVSA